MRMWLFSIYAIVQILLLDPQWCTSYVLFQFTVNTSLRKSCFLNKPYTRLN